MSPWSKEELRRIAQAGEVVTQLVFYAGWPSAFSALPVIKDVIEKRNQQPNGTLK